VLKQELVTVGDHEPAPHLLETWEQGEMLDGQLWFAVPAHVGVPLRVCVRASSPVL